MLDGLGGNQEKEFISTGLERIVYLTFLLSGLRKGCGCHKRTYIFGACFQVWKYNDSSP